MFYYHYEATEIVDNWRWKVVSWKSNWSIQDVFCFKTCSKYQKSKFELSFLQMKLAVFWGGRISVRTGKDMRACSSCFQYFLDKQLFRPYKEPWWYPLCAISVQQNLRTLHEKKHIKCNKHLHDARYFYTILVYQRGPFAYRQIKCFDTKCFYALCIVSNRFIFQFLGNVCKHYPHIAFKFEEEKSNYFGTYYNGRSYLEESCFELNHHQNCIAVCVLVTDTF